MSFDPPWREEMKDDSCFEPYYALTSTARCCFLFLFFFKKSAERWANHLIVVQHADDEQELTSSHSAVFDLQQIFSILPVCTLFDDVFVLNRWNRFRKQMQVSMPGLSLSQSAAFRSLDSKLIASPPSGTCQNSFRSYREAVDFNSDDGSAGPTAAPARR